MDQNELAKANETAHNVGSMIAFCFIHAADSDNFYSTAVEGLVKLADRLVSLNDQQALHAVIGALAKLDYTYTRPSANRAQGQV